MKEKRQSEASKLLPVRRECRFTSVSLSLSLSGRLELTGQRWRYYSESPSLSRSNRAIRLYIYYVQLQKKDGRILEAFRDLLQFPLRDGRTDRVASKLFCFLPKTTATGPSSECSLVLSVSSHRCEGSQKDLPGAM